MVRSVTPAIHRPRWLQSAAWICPQNPFRISYCAIPESVENLDPNSYALPEEYVLANVRNKLDYAYDDVPNRIADSKISKVRFYWLAWHGGPPPPSPGTCGPDLES